MLKKYSPQRAAITSRLAAITMMASTLGAAIGCNTPTDTQHSWENFPDASAPDASIPAVPPYLNFSCPQDGYMLGTLTYWKQQTPPKHPELEGHYFVDSFIGNLGITYEGQVYDEVDCVPLKPDNSWDYNNNGVLRISYPVGSVDHPEGFEEDCATGKGLWRTSDPNYVKTDEKDSGAGSTNEQVDDMVTPDDYFNWYPPKTTENENTFLFLLQKMPVRGYVSGSQHQLRNDQVTVRCRL